VKNKKKEILKQNIKYISKELKMNVIEVVDKIEKSRKWNINPLPFCVT